MAHYLVSAGVKRELLAELERKLSAGEFRGLRPFGKALSFSLGNARWKDIDTAVWEEEDYCSPPLAAEREAVLDRYFERIEVESVEEGEGWEKIKELQKLFE
ncbi:MAG: hypothetical protein V1794_05190 [Candidatus Glassbacteria bacterium]